MILSMHRYIVFTLWMILSNTLILSAGELRLQFIGNEAVLITDGKSTLLSDYPYRSGAFGYMNFDSKRIVPKGDVLSLITHGHADHFEPSLFGQTNWRIVGPPDIAGKIDPKRVAGTKGKITFNDIVIEPVQTPHANVDHYSYLVVWDAKRLYFTGDTESADALVSMKNLDVAFVTPWLIRTVQKEGKSIDAKQIIVYHHAEKEQTPVCDRCKTLKQYEEFLLQ